MEVGRPELITDCLRSFKFHLNLRLLTIQLPAHFNDSFHDFRSKCSSSPKRAAGRSVSHGSSDDSRAGPNHHRQWPNNLSDGPHANSEFRQSNAANHSAANANRSTIHTAVCKHHHAIGSNPTGAAGEYANVPTATGSATDAISADEGRRDWTRPNASFATTDHDNECAGTADDRHTGPANATESEHHSNTELPGITVGSISDPAHSRNRQRSSDLSECVEWKLHVSAHADNPANSTVTGDSNADESAINLFCPAFYAGLIPANANSNHHDNATNDNATKTGTGNDYKMDREA